MIISALDQRLVGEGEAAAHRPTIESTQRAVEWGCQRFWVAKHPGSDRNMGGSSPEALLARADRIRIGSGGMMLQRYRPYKAAEKFNVPASLAPGRVDFGIGRGPGQLPHSTQALQPQPQSQSNIDAPGAPAKSLAEKLVELRQFLHNGVDEGLWPSSRISLNPSAPTNR